MTKEQERRYEEVGHYLALLEELREASKILKRSHTRVAFFDLLWSAKGPSYGRAVEEIQEKVRVLCDHLDTQVELLALEQDEGEEGIALPLDPGPDKAG